MSRVSRVEQLLGQVLESDRTPEEVCGDESFELVDEVRARLQELQRLDAQLEAFFPPPPFPNRCGGTSPPSDAPLPQIPGYEVMGIVARGGMGVVYRARQLKLNRVVALKMLLAGSYASAAELARFRREAEAVAALTHPNIVQVYDVGELEGRPYYTMEFVRGGTLAEKLEGAPQPAVKSATMLAMLAEATHSAHQQGIVHRDLKPGNVLLTADATPKITDFGLARRFAPDATLTLDGVQVGTPCYMAPEQANGKGSTISPATDVYALGAILYEMLTGRPPFRGETALETQRQLLADDPVPPSRLNPRVPRDLETICLKCLKKQPSERYATAQVLAEDLQRFQRDEPIRARRISLMGRAAKWVRRHPAQSAAIAASALLVVSLLSGALWWTWRRAATDHAVGDCLEQVAHSIRRSDWTEARATLGYAKARLEVGGPSHLRARVLQAERDLDLVDRLMAIRMQRIGATSHYVYDISEVDRKYQAALKEAGLGSVEETPSVVGSRVHASGIRTAVVAALDDWAIIASDRRRWLTEVARAADPDPWRDRVRDSNHRRDRAALAKLFEEANLEEQPVAVLLLLAQQLEKRGAGTEYFRRVQAAHPGDFWANWMLAGRLKSQPESVGYYRAAVAILPRAAGARVNLGNALLMQGQNDQAKSEWQQAISLDPRTTKAHFNLGVMAYNENNFTRATERFRATIDSDPKFADAYRLLGAGLVRLARYAEARDVLKRGIELYPANDPNRKLTIEALDAAERLLALERRVPAFLDGSEMPQNAVEFLDVAEMLATRGRFREALPFFTRVIDSPELDAFRTEEARYNFACSAIIACTQPVGSPSELRNESDPVRAEWRRNALRWLRAALASQQENLRNSGDSARAAQSTLARWLADPDLASVREDPGLAQLPPEERAEWVQFWEIVRTASK
jgi:tetratricopeptide (TPR) repeat protein/tRNA A-37 threonylcarbamoyl transferase component Bud32